MKIEAARMEKAVVIKVSGRMDAVTALLMVHGTLTLLSLAVIGWRDGGWSMRRGQATPRPEIGRAHV